MEMGEMLTVGVTAVGLIPHLVGRLRAAWNRIYNGGGGAPVPVRDLAALCVGIARAKGFPVSAVRHQGVDHPLPSWDLNAERARDELGWSPKVGLVEGLVELIECSFRSLAGGADDL